MAKVQILRAGTASTIVIDGHVINHVLSASFDLTPIDGLSTITLTIAVDNLTLAPDPKWLGQFGLKPSDFERG